LIENNEKNLLETLNELRQSVRRHLKHLLKKYTKQVTEGREAGKWQWYSQIADSLMSDLKTFPRGTAECPILNQHTRQEETVRLNPRLDGRENAELLYKKARRGKRSADLVANNITATERELKETRDLIDECDRAITGDLAGQQLEVLVAELTHRAEKLSVVSRQLHREGPGATVEKIPFRHYTLEGYDIYVGKNTEQNDEMTLHFAKPQDIWMHVTPHAGSHVIIKRAKQSPWPPHEIIEKVAAVAAWYSKAKHATWADVHVTEARFVRKPRHFPAGKVIAERCKTFHVTPLSPQIVFGKSAETGEED
jgi:predicted ribosome quality control (RQC) complex YloA/Tae2 family protein